MKKLIPFLLIPFVFAACNPKDDSEKKEKTSKEKKAKDDDNPADEDKKKDPIDDAEDGWTSSQKKKAAARYLELLSDQNKSVYDSNSEENLDGFANCMISKISTRMSYAEYGEVMENVEAGKELEGLDSDLQKKAKGVNSFFDKCQEEFNIKTKK